MGNRVLSTDEGRLCIEEDGVKTSLTVSDLWATLKRKFPLVLSDADLLE